MASTLLELEEKNALLTKEIKQLMDDNKLMWDLWKQVQTTKPDLTQMMSIVVERERKNFAVKEQKLWQLIEEKDVIIQEMERKSSSASDDSSGRLRLELADLKSRYSKCLDIEGQLRDEVERLNKQLLDSDDVNNRLLVSIEKENNELKQTISNLQNDIHDRDCEIFKLSSNCQAASSSTETLLSELASFRQMVQIADSEISSLKEKCEQLRKESRLSTEEKDRLVGDATRQTQLVRELETEVTQLRSQNNKLLAEAASVPHPNQSPCFSNGGVFATDEALVNEVVDLKEQLGRLNKAYELKCVENEMLRHQDDKINSVERLHTEQRFIQNSLNELDKRLQQERDNANREDNYQQIESSLETERLVAILKQHCREIANDRDVYAGRVEKMQIQLANRESTIADLKLMITNLKHDFELELKKAKSECDRRVGQNNKQQASKITSELSRLKNHSEALEKKIEVLMTEKRRIRSQLSGTQARLNKETSLVTKHQDRIAELEQMLFESENKLLAVKNKLADDHLLHGKKRRARSSSLCTRGQTSPRKLLTFDMSTQTDYCRSRGRSASPTSSSDGTISKAKNRSSDSRQQLALEKMRVCRLLKLASDLKADRAKLRENLSEERSSKKSMEKALVDIKGKLGSLSEQRNLLEKELLTLQTELVRTRKSLVISEQKLTEYVCTSPRVDKSVITDQLDSSPNSPQRRLDLDIFEETKHRLQALMATEREQAARLAHYQVECDRLAADLTLARERLNDCKKEQSNERQLCNDQRVIIRNLEQQLTSDNVRIRELSERLAYVERNEKNSNARIVALKRKVEEVEGSRTILENDVEEKMRECEKLKDQMKKLKTKCQYVEMMSTADKAKYSRAEDELRRIEKKLQHELDQKVCLVSEFKRFIEMYAMMIADKIKMDRQSVAACEVSPNHCGNQSPSKGRAGSRQSSEATSIVHRAAAFAQTHLKLSAVEAAELLGSVDVSPATSNLDFDSPEVFRRKITNVLRQIFSETESNFSCEDSTQFANRLCEAFYNGLMEHLRFLLNRPSCCIKAVNSFDDKTVVLRRFSDSVFSGSPF